MDLIKLTITLTNKCFVNETKCNSKHTLVILSFYVYAITSHSNVKRNQNLNLNIYVHLDEI